MDRLHKLQSLGSDQFSRKQSLASLDTATLGAAASAGAVQTTSAARPVLRFPIRDVTTLPDSVSPSGLRLDAQYMDKISCWMQLMPSHMEVRGSLIAYIDIKLRAYKLCTLLGCSLTRPAFAQGIVQPLD